MIFFGWSNGATPVSPSFSGSSTKGICGYRLWKQRVLFIMDGTSQPLTLKYHKVPHLTPFDFIPSRISRREGNLGKLKTCDIEKSIVFRGTLRKHMALAPR